MDDRVTILPEAKNKLSIEDGLIWMMEHFGCFKSKLGAFKVDSTFEGHFDFEPIFMYVN